MNREAATSRVLCVMRAAIKVLAVAFIATFYVAVLGGCEVAMPPRDVECQVGHVAGKFQTTTAELDGKSGSELVRMWRGDRLFMWPAERIVACAEPDE